VLFITAIEPIAVPTNPENTVITPIKVEDVADDTL
jgi:hypothetical protein